MSHWWVFAILLASWIASADSAIVIRPATQISDSRVITLADISELVDVSPEMVKKMGQIKLADAPKVGERIEFSGTTISAALRGLDKNQNGPRPQVTIPSRIVVENIGGQLTEAQIRMELAAKWQPVCQCRIEFSEIKMPIVQPWIAGTEWRLRIPAQPARGSFTVAIELIHIEKGSRTLWLSGRAAHYRQVAVAQRQIAFGERIQPSDFIIAERDVTFARDAAAAEDQILGRKARQSIAAQDILLVGMLEKEKALKRGDSVKVALGEADWEVVLIGIAEQDGFIGDTVKIRNPKSQQSIAATVIGRGEVRAQ